MAVRIAVINLVALHLLVVCSESFATAPLVIVELESQRTIAQADSAQANAEYELAAWKLTQLKELQGKGHASWQEVAEQEVAMKSARASAVAAEQYVKAVVQRQAQLSDSKSPERSADYEIVKLYMPHTARLVAWMPTDVASVELTKQHLDNLRREHQSALDIDVSSYETAIRSAQQAVDAFGRDVRDVHLLGRAKIRLRLAVAQYQGAKARKAAANIIARRMVLVRDSLRANRDAMQSKTQMDSQGPSALAQIGTRFVDANSDRELTGLVKTMAADKSTLNKHVVWLEHEHGASADHVGTLQKLSQHGHADRGELDQAIQQRIGLESQIQRAQQAMSLRQRIANNYERVFDSRAIANLPVLAPAVADDSLFADANIVRHSLQLQKLKLQAEAGRTATALQRDYLVERMQRVKRIPEKSRAPRELDHIRHKVHGAEQQFAIAGCETAALDREQQRFVRQLRSQRCNQYQLVQVDGGQFIGREQFELAVACFTAVGFVGQTEFFPARPGMHPYIESSILFDCMSDLLIERPGLTAGLTGRISGLTDHSLLRRGVAPSVWKFPYATSGLRLATDPINNPGDLFCNAPFQTRQFDLPYRWSPRAYLSLPDRYRFRSCNPYASHGLYAGSATGFWRRSVLSYQVGGPPRSTFPYRSDYLFWSAFPTRSNLYANPYARPSQSFSGLGYTDWLNSSCFD